jgi:hypothetical protein
MAHTIPAVGVLPAGYLPSRFDRNLLPKPEWLSMVKGSVSISTMRDNSVRERELRSEMLSGA